MLKRCLSVFAVLALMLVAVSSAHATQVNTTLKVLIDNNWNVVAGDKRFDRFSLSGNVLPENFQVIALPGGLDPGPGLRFNVLNNAMAVSDDASSSVTIGFRVTVLDPKLRVKDVSLKLTDYSVEAEDDGAGVVINESIGTTSGGNDLAFLNVSVTTIVDGPSTFKTSDSDEFAGRSEIWVTKQVSTFADDEFDYANLTSFEQRFSQEVITPEPMTAGLSIMGLSALALAATRRRRA